VWVFVIILSVKREQMMVSVIIPAFNEEKGISKTLDSLLTQTHKAFEVIVVDNNSHDATIKVARKYQKKLSLRIVQEKKQGRGSARARGAMEAKGDILAYVDADTQVFKNWVEAIEKAFADKSVVAVTGPWRTNDVNHFTRWFLHTFQEHGQLPYRIWMGHFWLNGMNMAIHKSAYKKAGGFDEVLNAHEDIDLSNRLDPYGEIAYTPEMLVTTSARRYKNGLLRGLFSYQKTGIQKFVLRQRSVNLGNTR